MIRRGKKTRFKINFSSFKLIIAMLVVTLPIFLSMSTSSAESIKDEFARAVEEEARLAESIAGINKEIQKTQAELDKAKRLIVKSDLTLIETQEQRKILDERIKELEEELARAAIEGYLTNDRVELKGDDLSATQRLRAESILGRVHRSRSTLIDELKSLKDQEGILIYSAEQAKVLKGDNLVIKENKINELKSKKEQQNTLYQKAKQTADNLVKEAIASQELDNELRQLITERQSKTATIEGPLRWPVSNPRITSTFGSRLHPIYGTYKQHTGIDICPTGRTCNGAQLLAAGPGEVIFAGWKSGYGRTIMIDHGSGISTLYAHLSAINTSVGTKVIGQEPIGKLGATGGVTGAHLHFEVRVKGTPKNPRDFLN